MSDWLSLMEAVILAVMGIASLINTIFVVRLLALTSAKVTRIANLAEDLNREARGHLTNKGSE